MLVTKPETCVVAAVTTVDGGPEPLLVEAVT
jgi:hypothetical protein